MKVCLLLYALLFGGLLHAEEDCLRTLSWKTVKAPNRSGGEAQNLNDGTVRLVLAGPGSFIRYVNNSAPAAVVPGKTYLASAEVETSGKATAWFTLGLPGGTRSGENRFLHSGLSRESGTFQIRFTAGPDENQLYFYVTAEGDAPGSVLIRRIRLREVNAENPDYLRDSAWSPLRRNNGAAGRVERAPDGSLRIIRDGAAGSLWISTGRTPVAVVPGKNYLASAEVEITGSAAGGMMLTLSGGKGKAKYLHSEKLRKNGTLRMEFTPEKEQRQLQFSFCAEQGKGAVCVRKITLQEVPRFDPEQTVFEGEELRRFWRAVRLRKDDGKTDCFSGILAPSSSIRIDNLKWQASRIRSVEVDIAEEKPAALLLQFEGVAGGKRFSGFQYRSLLPGRKVRTVIFDMGKVREWQGEITSLELKNSNCPAGETRFRVTRVAGRTAYNLIPFAEKPGGKEIDLIRPGADYTLSRTGGSGEALALELLDYDGNTIRTIRLEPSRKSEEFTTPLNTVSARISYRDKETMPLLICRKTPVPDVQADVWNARWIWNAVDGQQIGTLEFRRQFTLPAPVRQAMLRFTGDDRASVRINGMEFWDKGHWQRTALHDISKALKAGENTVTAKVSNGNSYGGLLLELYAELEDGSEFRLTSDRNWDCVFDGRTARAAELGTPPCPPWGASMDCPWIGRKIKAEIRNFSRDGFEIRPAGKLSAMKRITLTLSGGAEQRRIPTAITPDAGKWKPGEWNRVSFHVPPDMAAGMKSDALKLSWTPAFLHFSAVPECAFRKVKAVRADFPSVKLIHAGKRPWIRVNGRNLAPFYFDSPPFFTDQPLEKAYAVENTAAAGCDIIRISFRSRDHWSGPDEYDFSTLDLAFAVIRSRMPDGYVMINYGTYMPDWWLKRNPGSRVRWFRNHRNYPGTYQTMASLQYRKDASKALRAFLNHLRDSGNAARVIGIMVHDGGTQEWYWPNEPYGGRFGMWLFSGNSPADHEAYRAFLKRKHGKIPEGADIPEPARWETHDEGIFLDPRKSREVIDYFDFRNAVVAQAIRTLTGIVKEETKGGTLTGVYYGYHLMFSRMFKQFQTCGHLKLHEVVSGGTCDLFLAPSLYAWRPFGSAESLMQPAEAITGHGAIPVVEFDYRTYSESEPRQLRNGGMETPALSLNGLDRGFGMALTRSAGGHWMEMSERWFREELLLSHIASLMKLYRSLPLLPAGTTPVEVCLVSDEASALRTASNQGDGVHRAVIGEFCRTFPETGVCYRHVQLSDLLTPGLIPAHKFYCFLNTFELSDSQRKELKARLNREKASALWLYAPGVLRPGGNVDAAGIQEMTGIQVRRENAKLPLDCIPASGFGSEKRFSYLTTSPNFLPVGGYDTVAAYSGKTPVLVGRSANGRTDYFSAALALPVPLLRELMSRSGVHSYQKGGDVLYAGNDFLILHAASEGIKELLFGKGLAVRQILGPRVKFNPEKPVWHASSGFTYGFLLEKKDAGTGNGR